MSESTSTNTQTFETGDRVINRPGSWDRGPVPGTVRGTHTYDDGRVLVHVSHDDGCYTSWGAEELLAEGTNAPGVEVSTARKVEGWFVAESRPWTGNDRFIFGDDWSTYCETREAADDVAESWRRNSSARPAGTIAVFALVRVDDPSTADATGSDATAAAASNGEAVSAR